MNEEPSIDDDLDFLRHRKKDEGKSKRVRRLNSHNDDK